ncbi:hypothetical protein [Oribacterium sp. NK2B42]|uniref:hypothetical protein n=1 Tax=Oribacterium sp. NK2B42 TaxID=689781 RepID=UPI000420A57F|nr:hypothetical protein [Oribacterium sp. NK2B42]
MKEKYALLDTDFISKTHTLRKIERETRQHSKSMMLQRNCVIARCLVSRFLKRCILENLKYYRMEIYDTRMKQIKSKRRFLAQRPILLKYKRNDDI